MEAARLLFCTECLKILQVIVHWTYLMMSFLDQCFNILRCNEVDQYLHEPVFSGYLARKYLEAPLTQYQVNEFSELLG